MWIECPRASVSRQRGIPLSATACCVWISGLTPGAHHSCVFVIIVRSSVTRKTYARSTAAASPSRESAWLIVLSTESGSASTNRAAMDATASCRIRTSRSASSASRRCVMSRIVRTIPPTSSTIGSESGATSSTSRVRAVGPADPGPDVGAVVATAHVLRQAQRDVLDVVGVDQRQAVDADEIAGPVQEQAVEARGRGDDDAAGVDDREPVVGVVE